MQKQFVPYQVALWLKELGFNESCFSVYNSVHKLKPLSHRMYKNTDEELKKYHCTAPIWQQALDFFLHNYGVLIHIQSLNLRNTDLYYVIQYKDKSWDNTRYSSDDQHYHLKLAFFKVITLINNKTISHVQTNRTIRPSKTSSNDQKRP